MAIIPFLCLLLLLLFLYASSPAVAADSDPFVPDYLKLTLVWPGQKCSDSTCCFPTTGKPALDFFVQDMQAYTLSSSKPHTDCKMNPPCAFKINALASNITELYRYWPHVSCPSNNGLDNWRSLWCTYGSCSNLTQTDYFVRALTLRANLSLLTLLQDNGIVPSKTETYKLKDVEEAIEEKFGFSTVVECTGRWGRSKISKVHACVFNATSFIDCPVSEKSNCGDKVLFYPFTYDMLQGYDDDEVADGGEGIIRMKSSA